MTHLPPEAIGLYHPSEEHDACGVGLVAAINGKASRRVVESGITALKAVWHRGAVDADGKTGDGAGIHLEIPQPLFRDHAERMGQSIKSDERIAVGMVFLPRTDLSAQERCRSIVEGAILSAGHKIYGWRQVPVDASVIGTKAQSTRPEIEQILIANDKNLDEEAFERDLYVIRRTIEKEVITAQINEFYICSLSARSIIYKGLFLAEQLSVFYPDLKDKRFVSSFALYHQRYSTNTFPQWWLAQPFRMIAHNGEINTVRGNVNWMRSHQIRMASLAFGDHDEAIKPVVPQGASDSAALDSVFELLVRAGRSAPMAKSLLVPEAWSKRTTMPDSHRAMYAYCNSVMEPWDGPAALVAYDGRFALAGLDRNGLRPLRYTVTRDGLLIVGSESGMVVVEEENVIEKGRLGPGQMIAVDLVNGHFYHDLELKDALANARPFEHWVRHFKDFDEIVDEHSTEPASYEKHELLRRQLLAGLSHEDLELILHPQADDGKEAIGSMGDDTPLAVLSSHYRPLSHYFRQNFSQVTNPPIDPLREQRVMSLKTRFGNFGNVLDGDNPQNNVLILESPVLTSREYLALLDYWGNEATIIDCTFDLKAGPGALKDALDRIRAEAEDAVRSGLGQIFLTDEKIGPDRAPVPMILATGGVHTHLLNRGLRTFASLNVRACDCLDTHAYAVLIGVGATTVNAYLAQEAIHDRFARGLFGSKSYDACLKNWKDAIDNGLLKIISKMGISVISSYRGGGNFEALGLSRALAAEFFPNVPSKISGIGLAGIEETLRANHARAFEEDVSSLPIGGLYRFRAGAETHAFEGRLIHMLQMAVASGASSQFRHYTSALAKLPPVNLRDLMDFVPKKKPVSLDDVESVTALRKRFVTPGMSMGALSPEAHETLAIAMNRIGAKSVSGEGGEDERRFKPYANGDNANSPIKQIASGRFGVTANYLNNCEEIEIKVAQGAKPGEGGQLPGFKVTELIAKLRHATPGVMLISPPPHHDIYSIEDLAQLIYDLKQINPVARVCVKLVASAGIGTIAAGVAKAHADVIQISGHSGGTGASPQTSIKYAGAPWELGLAEVNQVLTLNRLRHRVKLRVDGGLKTGRDIVIGALLGAEEFGIGTASLVAMGCLMVRQCHSNTCPVGICTQDEDLRRKFDGSAEKVVNLMTFLAEDVREILAGLGAHSLEEIIGRSDLLKQMSRGSPRLDDLDLNPILVRVDAPDEERICRTIGRNEVPDSLDAKMIEDAKPVFERGEKMQLTYAIRNIHRAVGTRFSAHLVRGHLNERMAADHVTVQLKGSAGQSLGAFAVRGLKLVVFGDANDYVGKGLSGGTIIVRPPARSPLISNENTIIGNTVLYGATSGQLFASGQAGERFAVRNSGAEAVIEGCGDNGCEYMTGGTCVILGSVGDNFAAGMTGGMAFIYDDRNDFDSHLNQDTVIATRIQSAHWEAHLQNLIERHLTATDSRHAAMLLSNWKESLNRFWQVVPKEMLNRLSHPLSDEKERESA
ncbi:MULTISPECIES: glutamate synthase large subunit [unclassified Iodidimonas]|jgi:glutamate synthase (NADPH/NADH) large chain|uniref:glutamate synthase large subunit n=1 Tax=unclassified Iodidimonas TaxID=2626145 RepID=UPI0024829C2B|nr:MULTISPECIES: glutamate synthase large subunit [unclassified Iodidimonas]